MQNISKEIGGNEEVFFFTLVVAASDEAVSVLLGAAGAAAALAPAAVDGFQRPHAAAQGTSQRHHLAGDRQALERRTLLDNEVLKCLFFKVGVRAAGENW